MEEIKAEIITIGDEILYGQILDTNSQWISDQLNTLGVKVVQKTAIGDVKAHILHTLEQALGRASIVIMTGGLGPTKDDMTKHTLAEFFGSDMVMHEEALALITAFFTKRGRPMLDANRDQAMIPSKAEYLQNDMGTAPGMWFTHHSGGVVVSLPGVPYEMRYLMETHVIPRIKQRFALPKIVHRYIRTVGIGESFIAHKVAEWEDALPEHIRLAYLPSVYQVKMRLTAIGVDQLALEQELDAQIAAVRPQIGHYAYSLQNIDLNEFVANTLVGQKLTLATAESCTGGAIAALITSQPGSSRFFIGSVVAYDNAVKVSELGVTEEILQKHGAVSESTVAAMAEGVRQKFGSSVALATSGIAGPDGGSKDKPVGTIWIACAHSGGTATKLLQLAGSRENNIRATVLASLDLLRLTLLV